MNQLTRARKVLIAAVAVALMASALVFVGCACSSTQSSSANSSAASEKVTVPNVVSLTQADADKALIAAGLSTGTIKREASETVPMGSVISQNPKALTSVAKGSKVELVISTGKAAPKDVQVPDLKGKTQSDAEKALSDLGLVGVASNPEVSTEVAPGQVFKQSVAAGTTVKEGSIVAFTVALAPAQVSVPNVVGMTQDNAKATITNAQLSFDYTVAYNESVPSGTVISQSIAAGTQVNSGTVVSVQVSLGPAPKSDVQVPDVLTFSWADAEHALTSAGLQARYTGDPAGIVVAQDIAAGTMVAQGTMVTVMLSGRPEMVTVPKLVGLTVTSAEIETDKLGLALKVEEGGLHGTVTDQWPEEGTQVPQRTTIHIVVDDSAYK